MIDQCVFSVLDDREREIIELRFGLRGTEAMGLEGIGKIHGVSRERIRQIQNIALQKLREAIRQRDSGISDMKNKRREMMLSQSLKS